MRVFKGQGRWAMMAIALLSVTIMMGCAPTFKYSYEAKTRFPELKSYTWAPSTSTSSNQSARLFESNVQFYSDQLLAQKGFKKVPENADLTIKMGYDSTYRSSYELQALNLFIYKTGNSELVWQGTALGTIDTDAASGNLKQVVEGILANFPPKEPKEK